MVHSRSSLGSPVVQDSGQVGEQLFGRQAGSIILYKVLCSQLIEQREQFFVARVPPFDPTDAGWTDLERRVLSGSRWWTVDELRATAETVYPANLADLIASAL